MRFSTPPLQYDLTSAHFERSSSADKVALSYMKETMDTVKEIGRDVGSAAK